MYYLELLINGIAAGGTYALFAVGLTMVYGIFRFINFAHGEMIAWGAYGVLLFLAPPFGLPLWLAIIMALALTVGVALASERIAFRPLAGRAPVVLLIASIGVSFVLRGILQFIFGADLQSYGVEITGRVEIFGLVATYIQLAMLGLSLTFFAGLYVLLRYTLLGKTLRAVADNAELFGIMGLPLARVRLVVWSLGALFAATGGILLALDTNLEPYMGLTNLLKAFAAVLLGGAGNVFGALLGGLIIGIGENLGTAIISPGYKDLIAFAVVVIMLLFRPQGLFAVKTGVR